MLVDCDFLVSPWLAKVGCDAGNMFAGSVGSILDDRSKLNFVVSPPCAGNGNTTGPPTNSLCRCEGVVIGDVVDWRLVVLGGSRSLTILWKWKMGAVLEESVSKGQNVPAHRESLLSTMH